MNTLLDLGANRAAVVRYLPQIEVEAVPFAAFLRALSELGLSDANDLPGLFWRQGIAFVSSVVYDGGDYQPASDSLWCFQPLAGYFGYDPVHGTYPVVAAYAGSKRLRLLASLCLPYPAFSLAYDTHRNRLWVGDQAGRITGFDTINLQQATVFNTGFGRTWSLAWAGAEDVLMSGHQNGAIAVWDVQGRCRAHIDSGSWVRSIAVAPDGAAFLTSHNNGMSTIRRWSVSSLESLDEFTAYKSEIWSVQYLPDGLGFVSGGKDSIFTAQWFTAKGTPAYAIKKHKGSISSVAVHPGGEFAVTGSWTGTLKLWNVHKGEAINSLEAHAERITGANFSDDGNLLASADKDGNIAVWQMPQCALLLNQHGHEGWIRGIRFFNDKQLATISSDGTCKIWLLEQGLPVSADIKTESALREGSDGLGSADTADDE